MWGTVIKKYMKILNGVQELVQLTIAQTNKGHIKPKVYIGKNMTNLGIEQLLGNYLELTIGLWKYKTSQILTYLDISLPINTIPVY